MSGDRFFLDTAYILALLNSRDQYHQQARVWLPRIVKANQVWITEAVLVELGNGLSRLNRASATQFIRQCYSTANMHVVSVDTHLLLNGLQLYQARPDKAWSLTACISFIVMQEQDLVGAVTSDDHFRQAGFRAVLLEVP